MSALVEFLARVKPEQHDVVCALDALIRKAAPELAASLKWGNLTYHHASNVCALIVHEEHVNLQVWRGADIADPKGLLVGSGKQMRHIRVGRETKVLRSAISAIVKEAAEATRA